MIRRSQGMLRCGAACRAVVILMCGGATAVLEWFCCASVTVLPDLEAVIRWMPGGTAATLPFARHAGAFEGRVVLSCDVGMTTSHTLSHDLPAAHSCVISSCKGHLASRLIARHCRPLVIRPAAQAYHATVQAPAGAWWAIDKPAPRVHLSLFPDAPRCSHPLGYGRLVAERPTVAYSPR
jgi:hypothetical protein